MIIQISILIMLWLFTCAVCAVGGFIYGRKAKTKKTTYIQGGAEGDSEEVKQFKKEMENFYSYTGTEQD